jgi:hypothetical protein
MKALSRTAAALFTVALAAPCWAGEVKIEIRGGLVTLSAKDASVREVLNEWSRVGRTRIVNAERVPAGLLTLELNGVPEAKALDIVLRSVAGYVAAPRRASTEAESRFDRIVIMAVARPAGGAAPASTVSTPPPASYPRGRLGGSPPQPQAQPSLMVDDEDEPVVQPPPQPQPVPPMAGSVGTPQPGMLSAPPGMPVAPGQAPQATPFPPGQQPNSPAATRPGMMTPAPTPVPKPPGPPGGPGGN